MGLFSFLQGLTTTRIPLQETHDFIAIDFETATASRDSACAVGIASVKDLVVIDSFYSLIKPPDCHFSARNIAVHGIRPEDVKSAPTMTELWPTISHLFGTSPVVAHNAHFDMSVLKSSLEDAESLVENFEFFDTMTMARRFVSGRLSLDSCACSLGVPHFDHHDAKADAIACAQVAIQCLRRAGINQLPEFCEEFCVNSFEFKAVKRSNPKKHPEYISPSSIQPCSMNFDCTHKLYGKQIVFTGELSICRHEAMQIAADVGAVVKSGVSSKTDYLVVGKQDLALVGDDGMSSKEEKAAQLNASGKAMINVIGEYEFMRLVRNEDMLI